MQRNKRYAILTGAVLSAALTLSACGNDADSGGSMNGMGHGASSSSTTSRTAATGQAGDVMFAQMMIPHHQQAVEMADLALQKDTTSPQVLELAQKIKAAQDPEIETMSRWLHEWNASTAPPMSHGSGGMMSDADMKELSAAKGPTFDRLWLTMMIKHHQGAVGMAQDVLTTTTNPDVRQMAQAIVDGQNTEIATMEALL